MLKTRQLIVIFLPALLIIFSIFFIRFIQYQPLYPEQKASENSMPNDFNIPIFSEDPIIGDRQAGTTLIVFSDLGCTHCGQLFSLWLELAQTYPKKFKIIWKALSATQFPYSSEEANRYSFCANQQGKFLEFANLAFQNNSNLSPTTIESLAETAELNNSKLTDCLNSGEADIYLQKAEQLATLLNVQYVPTIFLNNKQIEIPQIEEGWKTLLGL